MKVQKSNSHQGTGKNKVWNTALVEDAAQKIRDGIELEGGSPFWEGHLGWKKADLIYDYTAEELKEIVRCRDDVVYFSNKYCVAMTDDGIQSITLRDYQEDVLRQFQDNRFNVFLASRQIGKTVTTAIFITWYLLFNVDKNVLVLANKGATTAEIMDKIKMTIKGLPFFLKPGLNQNNILSMRFDNGCRMIGQSTTKTAAIGFTIHLCYMDEFAHIHANFIEPFYRSVYPTISSSQISRIIITSTPNGRNKFHEIYQAAVEGKNEYNPLRVDWWQVPGRDEEWKRREIANLGNEELFNQEYGNQFVASDTLLLPSSSLKAMARMCVEYEWRQIDYFEEEDIKYEHLKWHPDYSYHGFNKETDRILFSVDISDGVGRDHSVINIFKVEPMSRAAIRKLRKDRIENESHMFRYVQIGLYRDNKSDAEQLAKVIDILAHKVFDAESVKIAAEVNFKGDLFRKTLEKNDEYFGDMMLYTRHAEGNKYLSPGIKYERYNKVFFCRELRRLVLERRLVFTEKNTFEEMSAFGLNKKGSYSSQSGNDDIAMTGVNCVPMYHSDAMEYMIEDIYDNYDEDIKTIIHDKLIESDPDSGNESVSFLKDFM